MGLRLLILLLLLPLTSGAQRSTTLTRDSLPKNLKSGWIIKLGDNSEYAAPSYNDLSWTALESPMLNIRPLKAGIYRFDTVAWLRLHFEIDSSMTTIPLALSINHLGASQFYLDGKLIASYGHIASRENSEYFDPNAYPLVINIRQAGTHTLAVRYANYEGWNNYKRFREAKAGFSVRIDEANDLVDFYTNTLFWISVIFLFTFAFFTAFFVLHLALFIHNSKDLANLFFSIFCLSFGLMFIIFLLQPNAHRPIIHLTRTYQLVTLVSLASISLSGFLNTLFAHQKTRLLIITMLFAATLICLYADRNLGAFICFILVTVVCAEAIYIISRAIFRKEKGAILIGIGILALTLIILTCIVMIFMGQESLLNDSTEVGRILLLIMLAAILSIPTSMSVYLSRKFAAINKDLTKRLKQVEELSQQTLRQEQEKQRLLESRREELEREVAARTSELATQKERSDELLYNILPEEVAEELKNKGTSAARHFDHVSVMFTDFVDFTKAGERLQPQQLVDELHACFKSFDEIIARHNIEKIKTIGDAYLAVCGLPVSSAEHAVNMTRAAMEIRDFMLRRRAELPDTTFQIRIGIHSGPVVAGIVGVKKFAYDIWGDTVNTAARMEQSGEAGKVNISAATYELIKDIFACTFRGKIQAKNKGELSMYFVDKEL